MLLAAEHHALTKNELITKLDFFLTIQRKAPYSALLTIPNISGEEILNEVIKLDKVNVSTNNYSEIISLAGNKTLEMSYYRNNILHTYVLPSLVCCILSRHCLVNETTLIKQVNTILMLIKKELFLWQQDDDITVQIQQVLTVLVSDNIIKQTAAGVWSLTNNINAKAKIRFMGLIIDETLQRFAILTNLLDAQAPITRKELEKNAIISAQRLSVINHVEAPEFTNKKSQTILINTLKDQGIIVVNKQGDIIASPSFLEFNQLIESLVSVEVWQSIRSS